MEFCDTNEMKKIVFFIKDNPIVFADLGISGVS